MTLPSSDPNDVSSFPAVGEVIEGKYEIREVIGTGGMAAVAKANHVLRRAPVALKFMSAHVAAVPGAVDRFVNEAVAASQIESEHVVKVFDVCRLPNGAPYLVMEYLDGVDLAGLLERDGRPGLVVPRAIHVTLQVLRALEVAHRSGIVHRDVKPSNCFVIKRDGDPDFVKLLDFGISKLQHPNGLVLTGKSETLGTPLYMSPEQAHSPGNVDARTDLYSVGVVLYELLAGRTPFEANNITLAEHLFRLFTTDPPPISLFCPNLPPGLAETVHHALMRDPQQRIATASEFAARIVPFADERSLPLLMRFGPQVYRPGTALSVTIQDAPADPMVYTMSEATAETMPPPGAVTLAASKAYGMGPAATAQRPMAASAASIASPVSASPVSLGGRGVSAASNVATSAGSAAQGRGDLAASKATPPASSAKVAVPVTNASVRTTRDARPLVRTGLAVHPRPPARFEEVLAKEATKGSADLPKLPKLVRDVMNLARRNDVDFKEVTKLAETEPTLASRILTVANSAVYSRGVRLTDIKKSLIRIGGQTTKEILYQTAYAKSFEVPLFQPYVDASFVHAVIVAKLVRRLGELKGEDPDNAYIAGLFHDVGRPYCFKLAAQNPNSVPGNIEELVRLIDANHETAGDLLLQRWRLPAPIAEACRAHHQPAVSGLPALIQLADTVARHLETPARSSLDDIFGAMKLLELEDVWAGRLLTLAGDTEDAVPFPKGP